MWILLISLEGGFSGFFWLEGLVFHLHNSSLPMIPFVTCFFRDTLGVSEGCCRCAVQGSGLESGRKAIRLGCWLRFV